MFLTEEYTAKPIQSRCFSLLVQSLSWVLEVIVPGTRLFVMPLLQIIVLCSFPNDVSFDFHRHGRCVVGFSLSCFLFRLALVRVVAMEAISRIFSVLNLKIIPQSEKFLACIEFCLFEDQSLGRFP